MENEKIKSFYEDTFLGLNLRFDPDKLPDGFSPLAVNVDLTRMKTIKKREGTQLLGQTFTDKQTIQSLVQIVDPLGKPQAYMVRGGIIYKYDYPVSRWGNLHNNALAPEIPIASVTFKNRIYFTSPINFLCYTDGATLQTVGVDKNRIKGNCLAVGQRTLFIGNVEVDNVSYPSRVYYSRFNIEDRQETDEFWEVIEKGVNGNLLNSSRFFNVEGGRVRAIVSFANRDRVYIFSDEKCYSFNVNEAETNPFGALTEIFPIGCAGSNAVTVVAGVMYWVDGNGKMYAWSGSTTRPEEISFAIDDEGLGKSVVSSIDKSEENLSKICAFGFSKQVYFSVGTVQISNKQLRNACVKMFLAPNGLMSYTSIDTFPERPLVSAVFKIDNDNKIVTGNRANVITLKSGLNDVDENNQMIPVDALYRTKSYSFGYELFTKRVHNIYVKYKTQKNDSLLDIKVRTSNNITPIIVSDSNTNKFGVLNMKEKISNQGQDIKLINLPVETEAENISFEFGNGRLNESFEIQGFGTHKVLIKHLRIGIV